MLTNIANNLLESNPSLTAVLDESAPTEQYSAIKDKVTPRLCANIGRLEGVYIKRNELIWAIINVYNGEAEELVYIKAD